MAALTPAQLAAPNTEGAHQTALFAALAIDAAIVEDRRDDILLIHAIPNGGERNAIVASRMKAQGVRAGVWDIFAPVAMRGKHGLYIEMKKPAQRHVKNGGLQDNQISFGMAMHKRGYHTVVCYTWVEALTAIREYLGYEGPAHDLEK